MKIITITTSKHIQAFKDFFLEEIVTKKNIIDEDSEKISLSLYDSELDFKHLTEFFEDLILESNACVRGQPKLFRILKEKVFPQHKKNIELDLKNYFITYSLLNIEGYLRFRLSTYEKLVNTVLYSAVKQNLSSDN